jgi:hypothetical protein
VIRFVVCLNGECPEFAVQKWVALPEVGPGVFALSPTMFCRCGDAVLLIEPASVASSIDAPRTG